MTISLIKVTDYCSICGRDCRPATSIECDPLCTACAFALLADASLLPLPTPHDLAFALKEPEAAMPTNDNATIDFELTYFDLPQSPRPLWW